jgi:hypothetical protein
MIPASLVCIFDFLRKVKDVTLCHRQTLNDAAELLVFLKMCDTPPAKSSA